MLKTVKIQRYYKLFTKSLPDFIFLGYKRYCHIIRLLYTLKQLLFTLFLTQVQNLLSVIDIWAINHNNFLWSEHSHIFLHKCSTYVVNNTACFVCGLDEKTKRNLYGIWHSHVISSTMCHFSISMLVWICYIWYVYIGYIFLFPLKANYDAYACMESNSL